MKFDIHPLCAGMRPLSEIERTNLRNSLITTGGATDPVKIWKGQLIDGLNRVAICEEESLPYPTVDLTDELPDEEAVTRWILQNQLGRRNNTASEYQLLLNQLYTLEKEKSGDDFMSGSPDERPASKAVERLSKAIGVSESSIKNSEVYSDEFARMSPEDQEKVQSGEIKVCEVVSAGRERRKKEKAAKQTEPKSLPQGKSDVTEFIESQARRYSSIMNRLKSKVFEIGQAIIPGGVPSRLKVVREKFEDFCRQMTLELDELTDVFVCQGCFGAGCIECHDYGVIDMDTQLYQQRQIEKNASFIGQFASKTEESEYIDLRMMK